MALQNAKDSQSHTLLVDFSWKKFKGLVIAENDAESKPLYIVDCDVMKPRLVFHQAADDAVVAKGNLHIVSINADCEIRGKHVELKAMKRFKTDYTHLSSNYSDGEAPVPMRWTSASGFKTWDFICLDPQENAVARFRANIW